MLITSNLLCGVHRSDANRTPAAPLLV